jgi:ABC-type multidrug transport system fused ATPase/permease subunit
MIVASRVVNGQSKPSDFVIFITYLAQVRCYVILLIFLCYNFPDLQLYGPLNGLGYIYRSINQSLVDTEKLLKLLNEPTEVNDKPDAPDLIVDDGEIEFGMLCHLCASRHPTDTIASQITSAFRTMAALPRFLLSRSKFLRTGRSHLLVNPDLESLLSSVFYIVSMTFRKEKGEF